MIRRLLKKDYYNDFLLQKENSFVTLILFKWLYIPYFFEVLYYIG